MDKDLSDIREKITTTKYGVGQIQSIIEKIDDISEGVDVESMTDKELHQYELKLIKKLSEVTMEKDKVCK